VLRATEYVVPAIEIIDARVQNPRKIFDTVSDNGAAAGIVMGGRPVGPMDVDLRWVSGCCAATRRSRKPVWLRAFSVIRRWASPGSPTRWALRHYARAGARGARRIFHPPGLGGERGHPARRLRPWARSRSSSFRRL